MCAKNYKSKFTFVEVIQEKIPTLFSEHGAYRTSTQKYRGTMFLVLY